MTILEKDASSDDDLSVTSSIYSASSKDGGVPLMIGHKENRWVLQSRLIVVLVLALCASVTGYLTFRFAHDKNQQQFESEFEGVAQQIVKILTQKEENVGYGLQAFANSVTSHRLSLNQSWPAYVVPDLEVRAQAARKAAGVKHIHFIMDVRPHSIHAYNAVMREGAQRWFQESLAVAGLTANLNYMLNNKLTQFNYANLANSTVPETGLDPARPGPYYTISQSSPPRAESFYLYNVAFGNPAIFQYRFNFMNSTRQSARSNIYSPSFELFAGVGATHPVALYYQPLFESFEPDAPLAACFYGTYDWAETLASIQLVSDGGPKANQASVHVLIEAKNCNRTASYLVRGQNATFLGLDPHVYDPQYEYLMVQAGLSAPLEEIAQHALNPQSLSCHYSVRIYPTDDFRAVYDNQDPLYFTLVVLSIFAFTTLVFLAYDWLVQLRQDTVMDTAVKTDAIVNQMFPAQFRDQLLENNNNNYQSHVHKKTTGAKLGEFVDGKTDLEDKTDRPVADLFPQATILFADIAGFTAWSSSRDAIQVFQLLEAIYGTFDEIAKKRRVYKVETVGDSYVAACGVPVRRKDHAVNMVRFARDCLKALAPTVMNLERTLGPGTGDLRMRFGLHSGPVTAGVLRGERARFQLFGTTVNTASRIEATGVPNRIHLSEQTAEMLVAEGKSDWVARRQDRVMAKGLGELTTYWAKIKTASILEQSPHDAETMFDMSADCSQASDGHVWADLAVPDAFSDQGGLSENTQRLVLWNVELLTGLLEQVVQTRRRLAQSTSRRKSTDMLVSSVGDVKREPGKIILDEVAEIIELPDFEATTESIRRSRDSTNQKNSNNAPKLDPSVKDQLFQLVTAIAMGYRNNPFHNFEHASHVAMSVQKLLSRIIAPEIELTGPEDAVAHALHDHTYGITSDPLTQFAVVLSALIHDVDHRGVPNGQLAKEDPAMAAVYRNQSIAEQNSVDIAWSLFEQDGLADLQACIYMNAEERARFRQIIVNCVMATDIFDKQLSALRKARWNAAFAETSECVEKNINLVRNRKATIVIEHLIQASDVAHTMQHWHVYRKWNEKLFVEMYVAWKSGRAGKSPADGWYKGELWFFDNYVIPLAKKLDNCGVFGVSSDEYLSYAVSNRKEWEAKGQGVVAEMLEKLGHA